MNAILSKPIWNGVCESCNRAITFSPRKPMIEDEHEYRCGCGAKYWIDRRTGFYKKLGVNIKANEVGK